MKNVKLFLIIATALLLTSCQNSSNAVWEDTKTASRYLQRKGKELMGKSSESRMVAHEEDFYGPAEDEFVPLSNEDLQEDVTIAQPKSLPGSDALGVSDPFSKPVGQLATLFRMVHFNTDEHVVRDSQEQECLYHIATYLKKHPKTMIRVDGHCDARASQAYNLALGTRRANSVREYLVKAGANPEQIYTTSFGKEHPLNPANNREAWKENRRVEFKICKAKQ